jgi:signal peptidase I
MSDKKVKAPQVEEQTSPAKAEDEKEERDDPKELRKKIDKKEKGVKRYQYFILRLAIFLLVIWILFFQVVGVARVPNGDMYPRLDAGDMILYYRLDKDVKAQDVVIFRKATPDSDKPQTFVGRVVAVAGDTVEITDGGSLIVNGNYVSEPNIFYSTMPYEGFVEYPITLVPNQCFVLVDSRNGGTDSRYFGPVQKSELAGTVITVLRRNNL